MLRIMDCGMAAKAKYYTITAVKLPFGGFWHRNYVMASQNLLNIAAGFADMIAFLFELFTKSLPRAIANASGSLLKFATSPPWIQITLKARSIHKFCYHGLTVFGTLPVCSCYLPHVFPGSIMRHSQFSRTRTASNRDNLDWPPTIYAMIVGIFVVFPSAIMSLCMELYGKFGVRGKFLSAIPDCPARPRAKVRRTYTIGIDLKRLTAFGAVQFKHLISILQSP